MSNTETITIGNTDYTLRLRLGWQDQMRIDDAQFKLLVDGRQLSEKDKIENLDQVEVKMTTAEHTMARLEARIVGMNRRKIAQINSAHIPHLLNRIATLEQAQAQEEAELQPGNPTETK